MQVIVDDFGSIAEEPTYAQLTAEQEAFLRERLGEAAIASGVNLAELVRELVERARQQWQAEGNQDGPA